MGQLSRADLRVPALPFASGPTIDASHPQVCGWCLGAVATAERITHTAESGWCHTSCTTTLL